MVRVGVRVRVRVGARVTVRVRVGVRVRVRVRVGGWVRVRVRPSPDLVRVAEQLAVRRGGGRGRCVVRSK